MPRTGRKRKLGKREPNGRMQRHAGPDRGTEQLQARRAWLAHGGDLTKTGYPLGILLLKGLIDEPEHSAGIRYGWLHRVLFGRSGPVAASYGDVMRHHGPSELTDDHLEFLRKRQDELKAADRALGMQRTIDAVYAITVDEDTPRWLSEAITNSVKSIGPFQAVIGLQKLAAHMGYRSISRKSLDRI